MSSSVSIEQLTALCDEIAALVRAGVPLESGMASVSHELPGPHGRMLRDVGARLAEGQGLAAALRASDVKFPDYFIAMVEAGARSGRLGAALEGMADAGRRINEVRRSVMLAMVYPALLLFVAYSLFFAIVVRAVDTIVQVGKRLDVQPHPMADWVEVLADWDASGVLSIPIVIGVLVIIWVRSTRRAKLLQTGGGWSFGWLRPVQRMLKNSRHCNLAELLALLLEQQVPVPESVRLATKASGDKQLAAAGEEMAAAVESGQQEFAPSQLPPMIRWVLSGCGEARSNSPAALAHSLRRVADGYRDAATRQADWIRIYVPLLVTIVIGGGVTLFYALSLWLPWWRVIDTLADV